MTIEEKINNLTSPLSVDCIHWICDGIPSSLRSGSFKNMKRIDKLIKEADASECLTSSSEYIRECKKYFMENK